MTLYQPKSLAKLILYGFAFVSLPLVLALGYAALQVDRLAHQSQTAVYQAVQAITNSRQLIDLLTDMERSGRQYLILGDNELLEAFEQVNGDFMTTAQRLQRLPLDSDHLDSVDALIARQEQVAEAIRENDEALDQPAVAAAFLDLNELAQQVLSGSNRMVDREVSILRETAGTARTLLFALGLGLVLLTISSATLFTFLISRPVRQLDRAIRRLGDGRFDTPVQVRGPEDLEYLGVRLDWLRQRLMELEEQKGRFLRHMSHELKTPLTAIREGAELLQDQAVGDLTAEQHEVVSILQHNTVALQRLIEDLLRFSTAPEDSGDLQLSGIRLPTLIDEVARNHKPVIMSKSLRLDLAVQDIHFQGDLERLRTLVDNLLSNAVKFSPRGGTIRIEGHWEGDAVIIEVADQGPGIPLEERESVFDAFFQGRHKAEGYVKGSGLGLSIARGHVEAHGGSISVSGNGSHGTCIRVTLPRHQPAMVTMIREDSRATS